MGEMDHGRAEQVAADREIRERGASVRLDGGRGQDEEGCPVHDDRLPAVPAPAATIPTNLEVAEAARKSFPAFYAALFYKTLEKTPGAVVTEYVWNADSCDPCPGSVQGLTMDDLASLGADVLPSAKRGVPDAEPAEVPRADVTVGAVTTSGAVVQSEAARVGAGLRGRLRSCYQSGLNSDPSMSGSLTVKVDIDASGSVAAATAASNTGLSPAVVTCVGNVFRRALFSEAKGSAMFPLSFIPLRLRSQPRPPLPRRLCCPSAGASC